MMRSRVPRAHPAALVGRSEHQEILDGSSLLGMYAAAGSALLILGARLVALAGTLWRGYCGRDDDAGEPGPSEPTDDPQRWERDRNDTR